MSFGPCSNPVPISPQSQPLSEWTRATQLWKRVNATSGGEPSGVAQMSICRIQLVNEVLGAVRRLERKSGIRPGGFNGPSEPPLSSILEGAVDRFNRQMEVAAYRRATPDVAGLVRLGFGNPDS